MSEDRQVNCIINSPSGDTDIVRLEQAMEMILTSSAEEKTKRVALRALTTICVTSAATSKDINMSSCYLTVDAGELDADTSQVSEEEKLDKD